MPALISAEQVRFLSLESAIFCAQCELISANNTSRCLACGSQAVLSLSRILGGSLRSQPSARLIEDDELNRLVRQLLDTVPAGQAENEPARPSSLPARHHARCQQISEAVRDSPALAGIEIEPAVGAITEGAQVLTGATGAAIALRKGNEIICRARAGRTAPDLGVRLQTDSGISAQCLRTGEVVLCNNAEANPHADRVSCRSLGVRSILAAPLRQFHRTLGIFEVLSALPNAFTSQHVATMQLLSSLMVAAVTRASRRESALGGP